MGCGNSKLNPELETAIPLRIRSIVLQKFLEMKGRRNVGTMKSTTLSKKVLLTDGFGEDNSLVGTKSTSSAEDSVPYLKNMKDGKANKIDESKETKHQDFKENKGVKNETTLDEDGEDKDEDEDENEDNYIFPRSPSFRVYCIQPTKSNHFKEEEEEEEEECNEETSHQKTQSNDSINSIVSENSNDGQDPKMNIKKGVKGRGFRKAMKKGGQGAVKSLKSVKSCYKPGCSSQDVAGLLAEKPAASSS